MAWFLPVLMNFLQIYYTTAENPSLYFRRNLLMFCETAVVYCSYNGPELKETASLADTVFHPYPSFPPHRAMKASAQSASKYG